MKIKQLIFYFLVITIYPTIVQPNKEKKQLLQLPALINPSNVNTPLKDIPGAIVVNHYNPLTYAISLIKFRKEFPKKYDSIIDHLIRNGATPVNPIILMLAVDEHELSLVKKLIDHGATIPRDALTLHCLWNGELSLEPNMIELLLQHGAHVNARGWPDAPHTALCHSFKPDRIQCLLDHGANTLTACTCFNLKKNEPANQRIMKIFDALKDSGSIGQSTNLDHDAQSLKKAYQLFQQGNHEPLREMLVVTPWVLSKITGLDRMAVNQEIIPCQQIFKKESILPLIRYLALAPADLKTMCAYNQLLQQYKLALEKPKTKKSSCCSIS